MTAETEVTVPTSSSEAHLDLLLAEELSVNRPFLRHFVERCWAGPRIADTARVTTQVNVWDAGGPECVAEDSGENDIDITVTTDATTQRILVEDKVWASFQPDQGSRYQRRARSRGDLTVLVAPRSRLSATEHRRWFDVVHPIEDLADWLDEEAAGLEPSSAHRLRWRAGMLRALCTPTRPELKPSHGPTVAFTSFCVEHLAAHEPLAQADTRSLRTAGNGWLWFTQPTGLVYKAVHGRVDLYVTEQGFRGTAGDVAILVARGWGPAGFVAAVDTKGNPVLRFEDAATRVHPSDGVPPDTTGVEMAMDAVVVATRWSAATDLATPVPST